MGEMVEFASNGNTASGYLVTPARGGPGVLVIQEWWGLDSSLKEVTDRLGSAGFVALAPDLYHGELAGHDEMDKAAQLMQSMPPDRAAKDMSGAVDFLAGHEAVHGNGIGVVGFCMGGMLSWLIAANRPDQVRAIVPFYGFPQGDMEPDWSKLRGQGEGPPGRERRLLPARRRQGTRREAAGDGQGRDRDRAPRHRPCVHGAPQRAGHA